MRASAQRMRATIGNRNLIEMFIISRPTPKVRGLDGVGELKPGLTHDAGVPTDHGNPRKASIPFHKSDS